MAELKLSTVWKIKDYAEKSGRIGDENVDECLFESDDLTDLQHSSMPGLHWQAELSLDVGLESAAFFLEAKFGDLETDAKYVWAQYEASLLSADGRSIAMYSCAVDEFTSQKGAGKFRIIGDEDAFEIDDLIRVADAEDGSLCIRIDLTIIVKVGKIFKCRELLRGVLANETKCDFSVKVDGETFQLHKSILAETSTVQSGMKEEQDDVLTLMDTTPAPFKAFRDAVYYDNWDFLPDIDLIQEVLYVSESAAICNAELTQAICCGILARHMEFKKSQLWLDFKKALNNEAASGTMDGDETETVMFNGDGARIGIFKKRDTPRVHFAPGTVSPPPSTEYRARFKAFAAARKSSPEVSAPSEGIAVTRETSPLAPWTPRKFKTLKAQILYDLTNPAISTACAVAISQAALTGLFGD